MFPRWRQTLPWNTFLTEYLVIFKNFPIFVLKFKKNDSWKKANENTFFGRRA